MENSKHPYRILLAKIGLDGHDRGVKVLARSFRDAGFDVIYTGLWQTPEATMYAAMQEDVDVVGVSLHSAAHLTIVPEVIRCREELGVTHLPVVVGGIVPQQDYQALRDMGVSAIFNPGSSLDQIIKAMRELADGRSRNGFSEAAEGYAKGEVPSLASLITHIQRGTMPNGWSPPSGRAYTVGITGAPGVGKSSFIGKLGAELQALGLKVAVLAVDPTSPISGGALLGDRLRMMSVKPAENFFVRSISSGDVHGALGPRCKEILDALAGFGFDIILLETVGAGQSDIAVREVVDETLLVLMPQSGDAIQFSKAGIMEIASAFVLNKCDLPGADATEGQLLSSVGSDRPIWKVSSRKNQGISQVAEDLARHRLNS